ncbi:MAG: 16S rRNA (guanine(527)-N(7))-methyltransferase RsmG [Acholeplasmataceae bacterium]|nr:MAG: 16S rRNA (guanine(527)-N(7))-methyltransferase RsmG [Acholeplasmataceae bacterium]
MALEQDVFELIGIRLDDRQKRQFESYFEYLTEYNQITNLTTITEREDVNIKHFIDSLTLAGTVPMKDCITLCDMGSGAGFPGIPLKIVYPHLQVVVIDSLGKRIRFLEQLLERLAITDVELVNDRIEHVARQRPMQFDLVTARALGNLSLICELGLPMTKIGGRLVAFKGENINEELDASKPAIKILGGTLETVRTFALPRQYGNRAHVVIKKINETKGYPRPFADMIKKPL